jgi:hypothetical protein
MTLAPPGPTRPCASADAPDGRRTEKPRPYGIQLILLEKKIIGERGEHKMPQPGTEVAGGNAVGYSVLGGEQFYGVPTKVMNQAVRRNIRRFPADFMFQLTEEEKDEPVTNCDRFRPLKHSSTTPYAFIPQGRSKCVFQPAAGMKCRVGTALSCPRSLTHQTCGDVQHPAHGRESPAKRIGGMCCA